MYLRTETERAQHPEARLIPAIVWNDPYFFGGMLTERQIKFMQASMDALEYQLNTVDLQYLKPKDKETTWLAIAFSHQEASDRFFMDVLDKLDLGLEKQVRLLATFGRLSLFEKILENHPDKLQSILEAYNYAAFTHAATGENPEIMEKIVELAPEQIPNMIAARRCSSFYDAANYGNIAVMKRLTELAPEHLSTMLTGNSHNGVTYEAFIDAARGGHVDIINWLLSEMSKLEPEQMQSMVIAHDGRGDYAPFRGAAEVGSLEILEKLAELAPRHVLAMIESYKYYAFYSAAKNGHLAVMVWLINKLAELAPEQVQAMISTKNSQDHFGKNYAAFYDAALNGHLAVMEKLIELAPEQALDMIKSDYYKAFRNAASNGHLTIIEWLIDKLTVLESSEQVPAMVTTYRHEAFRNAAKGGHVNVIEKLFELAPEHIFDMVKADGSWGGHAAFRNAADYGHLAIMEKLIEYAPEQALAMIEAGYRGEAYLAFQSAAANGHSDIVVYIFDKLKELAPEQLSSMIASDDYDAFRSAAKHGHVEVLIKLFELAPEQALNMFQAKDDKDHYGAFFNAAVYNHPSVVKFLVEKLTELAPEQVPIMLTAEGRMGDYAAFRNATSNDNTEVVLYILNKLTEFAPEQVPAMIASDDYGAFRSAASAGSLAIIKKIVEFDPEKTLAMIESNNYGAFYGSALQAHPNVMEWIIQKLTELAPEQLPIMIEARGNDAFREASREGDIEIVERLLYFPSIFSHAEMHDQEYGTEYIYKFVHEHMIMLGKEHTAFEADNPGGVFDITDPEQARLCFYVLRNMIRRNDETLLDDMQFLINIPSVKALLHTAVTPDQPNELLRLALNVGNRPSAELLLSIPAIQELAEEHDFYQNEARGGLDLRAIANDHESSMTGLTAGEQHRLEEANKRYQPMIRERGGVHVVMSDLRALLKSRYEESPAQLTTGDGRSITLPFSWEDWKKESRKYSPDTRERALKAYYQHKDHTAWRYLEKPNPWMANNAPYVNRDINGGWSTFETYQPLLSMLFLAAQDEGIPPTDGYTIETRVEHFIDELAHIGRSHNWDKTRIKIDAEEKPVLDESGQNITEEYDDLKGDQPSCYSGVKRRAYQAVQGHPLLKMLTLDDVKQELRDFIRTHFTQCILEHPDEAFMWKKNWVNVCETGIGAEALVGMDISQDVQNEFIASLEKKYPGEFKKDLSFRHHIQRRFELNDQITNHASKFGGEADLTGLLEAHAPKKPTTKEALREARLSSNIYGNFTTTTTTITKGPKTDTPPQQQDRKNTESDEDEELGGGCNIS